MNSVANGKIRERTPFDEVYIQPASGDNGTALGAAFYVWNQVLGQPRAVRDDARLLGAGVRRTARSTRRSTRARERSARAGLRRPRHATTSRARATGPPSSIADGHVVGWFQGRMEWGARALGNRSILADPRRADMREIINTQDQVPREVPAVRAVDPRGGASTTTSTDAVPDPFMMQVYPVRPDKRAVDSGRHARRRLGPPADGQPRERTRCYWQLIQRVRAAHRRADPAQHVVQRERADRADAGRGARLLSAHAHGRAGDRAPRARAPRSVDRLRANKRDPRNCVIGWSGSLVIGRRPPRCRGADAGLGSKRILLTGGPGFLGRQVWPRSTSAAAAEPGSRKAQYDLTREPDVERLYADAAAGRRASTSRRDVGGIGANRDNPGAVLLRQPDDGRCS